MSYSNWPNKTNDKTTALTDFFNKSHLLNSRQLKEEVFKRRLFFDRVAEVWEEEHRTAEPNHNLCRILQRMELKPGQVVLDAGCGTGRLAPFILKKIGPEGKLIAVDVSANMLKIARQKFNYHNLIFYQADVCELEVSGLFDQVICLCLLPHLPDKELALRSFRKYLKAEGQFIIAHTTSREEVNRYHAQLPEPICCDQLPERPEMIKLLQRTGFTMLELEESDIYFLRAVPS
ncbi:MAG: class I SAM-dependent methyltransferase [Candidatus Saccharicenans sp.]